MLVPAEFHTTVKFLYRTAGRPGIRDLRDEVTAVGSRWK
jgi:hypothetical protein